ncbi:MAG: LysE family transporter [Terracidiphilus sp.]|jgi:threonine/homoserine/homoserine lactone efflux protein
MAVVPYIHVLASAFLMGLAAAAPMGPVNMMAIRRGVAGGWRHTLACGIGSIFGDLVFFSLALIGGRYLLSDLSNPKVQVILAAVGVAVLFPVGIYFLVLAVKEPRHAFSSARRRWSEGPIPARLAGEAAKAAALTVFNPLTMLYWAGVTSSWLPFAYSVLGLRAAGWGLLMVGAGLAAWFTALVAVVRFIPHRTGATFFRLANAILGLILLGLGMYCAVILYRHLLR